MDDVHPEEDNNESWGTRLRSSGKRKYCETEESSASSSEESEASGGRGPSPCDDIMEGEGVSGEPITIQVQVKTYEWRFPLCVKELFGVDPPDEKWYADRLTRCSSGPFNPDGSYIRTLRESVFTRRNLKFDEDDEFLGKIEHSWEFGVNIAPIGRMFVAILLWIKDAGNVTSVPEVEIQLFRGQHRQNQQRRRSILMSEEKSGRQGYKGWLFKNEEDLYVGGKYIDSVKVVFKFQFPASGSSGVSNPSELNKKIHSLSECPSDVKLVSREQEFPAHRSVLACKSSVFEQIFQNPTKETLNGRVDIGDIWPDDVKELLCYIYTGEFTSKNVLENVHTCMVFYKLADKYALQDLRMECAKEIGKKVTFEIALDVYVLGRTTVEKILIKKALEVLKRDKAKFLRNPDTFLGLAKQYPGLAFELATM